MRHFFFVVLVFLIVIFFISISEGSFTSQQRYTAHCVSFFFGPGVQQAISDPTAPLKNHWKEKDSWREMERQAAKVLMEHQREAIDRYLAKGVGSVEK